MNTKTDISAAYVGSTGVDKLCLGNEVVWQNTPPGPVPYEQQYLTFKITSPGTIRFAKAALNRLQANTAPTVTIYYKVNSGDWTAITTTTAGTVFNVASGDTVQFKGDNPFYGASGPNLGNSFSGSTAFFNIEGNIMSLIDSQNFATIDRTWVAADHARTFPCIFANTNVVDASNLVLQPSGATQDLMANSIFGNAFYHASHLVSIPVLPATTLEANCYFYMFDGCTSLTTAPSLPATTLAGSCYQHMFAGCTGLTSAPALPVTTLAVSCYNYMFSGCRSLTTAPVLPATTLAQGCYTGMFYDCDGLTTAPALPATTLANNCYQAMFQACNNLTAAPVLPATTLANNCYQNMFAGCTSLTTSPELLATTLASNCYAGMFSGCTSLNTITCIASINGTSYTNNWVKNVAATGTFYRGANAIGWTAGVNGIPVGWTVQDYAPVLKIAGQSIRPDYSLNGDFAWSELGQYSGTSFTIEFGGVSITADTWDYSENYIDECGQESEISHDSGTTMSVFEAYSGYISFVSYGSNNNSVSYTSYDDQTSEDSETICRCQGLCWDGEACVECTQSCEDQGLCDDGEGNCVECPDPCDDWEGVGYSSYEECTCAWHGEGCEEGDPCDDYEGAGYGSYEECTCAERGENCPEESGEEESGE